MSRPAVKWLQFSMAAEIWPTVVPRCHSCLGARTVVAQEGEEARRWKSSGTPACPCLLQHRDPWQLLDAWVSCRAGGFVALRQRVPSTPLITLDSLVPGRSGRNYDKYICQKDLTEASLWSGFQARGLRGIVMTDGKITVFEVRICAEKLSNCSFRVEPILMFM